MRVGALIIGILGGLIALVIGQLGFALGGLIGFPQLKALSVILPILALQRCLQQLEAEINRRLDQAQLAPQET